MLEHEAEAARSPDDDHVRSPLSVGLLQEVAERELTRLLREPRQAEIFRVELDWHRGARLERGADRVVRLGHRRKDTGLLEEHQHGLWCRDLVRERPCG